MDKTTAMTGTTAADRHDRRATAGSGHPRAALAAEAGRLKAKVERLMAVPTRLTTDRSTSGQAQVSKLLALTGTPPSGALGPQLLRPKQAGVPTVGRSCKLLPHAKSIQLGKRPLSAAETPAMVMTRVSVGRPAHPSPPGSLRALSRREEL